MVRQGKQDPRDSRVLQVPAAEPREAEHHFLERLSLETDPSDVQADLAAGVTGFILVDCRSAEDYAAGHIPGAVSMPYRSITVDSALTLSKTGTYVTYDAGLYDNTCTKTALRLAALGFRVKEMMGGLAGWKAEGYAVEVGAGRAAAPKPKLNRI